MRESDARVRELHRRRTSVVLHLWLGVVTCVVRFLPVPDFFFFGIRGFFATKLQYVEIERLTLFAGVKGRIAREF